MLIWFVVLYLMVSIGIGLYAATRVHTAKDFAVAGRHLPLPVVTATVFATWFGAEAVFGVSATFVKEGLGGVVADPFGSSMCLIIAGFFFANKLYKLNILTLGDYFRLRYNRTVEVLTTLCIVSSYLGWVSAQIKALGLVFNVVTNGFVSQPAGMVLGAAIVLTYTTFGGMLSVAILDFVQMGVIMGGMLFIGYIVSGLTGGVDTVIQHASAAGKLNFFPEADPWKWLTFLGAWITMMLGSIPQQDVFQRITSAKTKSIALWGSILGASIYFCFTFVPMFIAYSATLIDPELFNGLMETDSQLVLPTLVLQHTPVFAQAIFFGAVLSAIMSCSSATLLAPSVDLLGEHRPRLLPAHGRPPVPESHARLHRLLRRHRARLRAVFQRQHLQDGRERLQGHAGRRLRAAFLRRVLEACNDTGRAGGDHRRPALLGAGRSADRRGQPCAAATDRTGRVHPRHGRRLAAAAVGRPPPAGPGPARDIAPPCRVADPSRRPGTPTLNRTAD
jgi:Na+/pantothenate symporter